MSVLIEGLRMLGLKGGAIAAATCIVIAFYLLRAKRVGSRAAALSAAAVAYTTTSLIILGIVLALGWADPNPAVAIEDTKRAISVAIERGKGPAWQAVRWLVETVS